jgi:hypothetical protein
MQFIYFVYLIYAGIFVLLMQKDDVWMHSTFVAMPHRRQISLTFKMLSVVCLLLLANGWGDGIFNAQILFDNPRVQGLIKLFWYVLVWICVIGSLNLCRLWIKLSTLVLVVPLLAFATLLGTIEAIDTVKTNSDISLTPVDLRKLSSNLYLATYFYNGGVPGWSGLVERKEFRPVCGLLIAYGYKKCDGK